MSQLDTGVINMLYASLKSGSFSLSTLKNLLFADNKINSDGFLNSDEFKNSVSLLSSLFDFNKDGTLDAKDIEFFKKNCTNLSFMINLVNSGICVTNTLVNTFSTAKFTKSDLLNIGMKIIVYSLFVPLVTSENFLKWCTEKGLDDEKTNLDVVFDVINMIYNYVNTSSTVANIADKLAKKLINSSCCSKKTNPDQVASEEFAKSASQLQMMSQIHVLSKNV